MNIESRNPKEEQEIHIPPKSPDITNEINPCNQNIQGSSFKEKLLAYESLADPNTLHLDTNTINVLLDTTFSQSMEPM